MTTKKKTPIGSKTVHFSVTGEAITRIARDMWVSYLPKNALSLLLEGMHGMTKEYAIEIIIGEAKLIGENNDVTMVKDNAKYLDQKNKSCPLHTPKKLAILMEEELIELELNYLFVTSKSYEKQLYRDGCYNKSHIVESAASIGDKIKKRIEQLLALYPYVGKTFKDMPIFNYVVVHKLVEERDKLRRELEDKQEQAIYEQGLDEENKNRFSIQNANKELEKRFANVGSGIPGIPEINVEDFVRKQIEDDNREDVSPEDASKTEWTSGYIDRKGNFFGCSDIGHSRFADDLRSAKYFTSKTDDSQQALDELGWMKISMNRILWGPDICSHIEITQKQIDTLFDYINGKKLKEFSYNGDIMTYPKFLKEIKV